MAQQLEEVPGVSPSAVREVYGRLAREGLLAVDDDQRTWVAHTARPAADPHPPLPPGWVEELRHTLTPEGADRTAWFTQTLHAHIAPLPPGTRLPSSRELGERLKDLKLPATAPERAYRQLAAERLLVTKGGKGTYVADPEPADRAARSAAPQTAEAALPPDWVEELRRTLHTTPKPEGVDHTTWLAQALHAHIASLPPGTRLPTHRRLGERLKDLGFGRGTVQKAYERLRKTGQLTSKFGDGTWVADPGAPLKQAAGSGSSRAVAAAAPPEPGHLEEPGPGGVAAAEPPPWAGQQPQESQPPQRPAHAAGATEGVAGAASDGGPGPGDPWPSGDTETDATSAIAPRPLPVAGAPEAPWGSGVLHRGAGPSAPEGSLGALERAGGDALLAGGDAWEAPPEPSDSGIRGILAFLARDDRGLPARDAAGHIGLPHPPEAPPEAAFGPAEPGSLPVLSAPLDPAHAAPGPGPGRSPHPAPLPDWLEGLRYALTSRTPSPARRLAHALRTLIRKGDLTPGMRLPGQGELVRQLQHPEIGRKAVKGAYAQLGKEGLLTTEKRKGTWVAGAAGDPPPSLPADWLEGLQRALKEHPLLEETLREHVQGLPVWDSPAAA
jgi:DNA-binding FadR family transcriptional regulator